MDVCEWYDSISKQTVLSTRVLCSCWVRRTVHSAKRPGVPDAGCCCGTEGKGNERKEEIRITVPAHHATPV